MEREELVLAAMSVAGTDLFSPVQVQKLFFLIDEEIRDLVEGPHFQFTPYHYGPFDAKVYRVLEDLRDEGDLYISAPGTLSYRRYQLTQPGVERGLRLFAVLPEAAQEYIKEAVEYVRRLGFRALVASIYKAYPDMKVNSVLSESTESA